MESRWSPLVGGLDGDGNGDGDEEVVVKVVVVVVVVAGVVVVVGRGLGPLLPNSRQRRVDRKCRTVISRESRRRFIMDGGGRGGWCGGVERYRQTFKKTEKVGPF